MITHNNKLWKVQAYMQNYTDYQFERGKVESVSCITNIILFPIYRCYFWSYIYELCSRWSKNDYTFVLRGIILQGVTSTPSGAPMITELCVYFIKFCPFLVYEIKTFSQDFNLWCQREYTRSTTGFCFRVTDQHI